MPKYRKKPVVINAFQWFPEMGAVGGVHDLLHLTTAPGTADSPHRFYIPTLEGNMTVSPGDFVITGVKGEQYPCKPDIFHQTYERVED